MDPSNSSSKFQWKYDVFLSFRGIDTRKSFTDHLYVELIRKGINAYRDDIDLERGENISKLLQAIKDSRFSIIIFSKNYAASSWCLDELVTIVKCVDLGKHTVVPIFYDVDPSEVSEQMGGYGEAMKCHEESLKDDIKKVKKWRNALTSVADHSGWDLRDKHEVKFIQEVVEDIIKKLRKLSNKFSSLEKVLVGIDKHLFQMDQHLNVGSKDVRIIGICGMGGIGKTTIARTIHDKFSSCFEGNSFVANIREIHEKQGLVRLQEQLLSEILYDTNIKIWDTDKGSREIRDRLCHKMVLIILDDVSKIEQLETLAGVQNWFGNGSRIIITTRDEHLLIDHGVEIRYKVQELSPDEALQLFYLKAFSNEHPTSHHLELANEFVKYACGLPLALDVLGHFVNGGNIDEWKDALDGLKKIPNENVTEKLEISFRGLGENEKEIFLDIACIFKGESKYALIRILESFDFNPTIGLRVLLDKSLISIFNNKVEMHDLLQEIGREIVRRESPKEPGRRSRLWRYKDVCDILFDNMGTEKIEGIMVQDLHEQENKHSSNKALTSEVFFNMSRLRLLKLEYVHQWRDVNYLPKTLKYLDWKFFPFKYFPPKFEMDYLVELHMQHSKVRQFWKETNVLQMLKIIDLRYSVDLVNTPDFTKIPNLEELNLEGCINLLEVNKSVGFLQKLVFLNLENCNKLVELPNSIGYLKSLKTLILNGCSKLNKLPEEIENLTCLENLYMRGINARQQPSTKLWDFINPLQLVSRKRSYPKPLVLPNLSNFSSLTDLDISYCNLEDTAPLDNLNCCPLLKTLRLCGNDFVSIPESINKLTRLVLLSFADCKKLEWLPDLSSSLAYVSVTGCSSLKSLPSTNVLLSNPIEFSQMNLVNYYELVETYGRDYLAFKCLINFLPVPQHFSNMLINFLHVPQHIAKMVFGPLIPECLFKICLPGGEIPWWFSNVYVKNTMRVNLSPSWCNDDWMGFALCVSFSPQHAASALPDDNSIYFIKFCLRSENTHSSSFLDSLLFSKKTYPTSDHIWLIYLPREMYSENGIITIGNSSIIDVDYEEWGLRVKECAFRLVYKQDVKELMQRYGSPNGFDFCWLDDNNWKQSLDASYFDNEVGE